MAARTMTNAAMLLMMASIFNFTNQLALPKEETITNYQSVLKAINKDGTEIENGIKYDDKTTNRVQYNIEEWKDIEADEDAEKDIARREDILASNVKNDYNIPSTVLIADRDDISKYRYDIDANTDEGNKSEREDSSIFNGDISSENEQTVNIKEDNEMLTADRAEKRNAEKDTNRKEDSSTLKTNLRSHRAIMGANIIETKIDARFLIVNTHAKKSGNIKLSFETPKGTFDVGSSKRRLKRDSEYDDDLYIWDNCEGKEHLAYIDGVFKCVEVSLENRNFGTLTNCPAGKRRVFLQNSLILCLARKKRRA